MIFPVATGSAPTESEISSATTASSTSATSSSSARFQHHQQQHQQQCHQYHPQCHQQVIINLILAPVLLSQSSFFSYLSNISLLKYPAYYQEEHCGKASPEQIQPKLEKHGARRQSDKKRRRLDERLTKATTTSDDSSKDAQPSIRSGGDI